MRDEHSRHSSDPEQECISDDLLLRFLERQASPAEGETVKEHLQDCETCLHIVRSVIQDEISPAAEADEKEIGDLLSMSSTEQVNRIISYYDEENPPAAQKRQRRKKIPLFSVVRDKLGTLLAPFRQPAFGAAITVLLALFGGYKGIRYYNTGYQILKAEQLLQDEYRTYFESARLSGDYGSSGINRLMSERENEWSYLNQAKSHLQRAINHGGESLRARKLLLQIYIMENNESGIDSMFTVIEGDLRTSAPLMNDFGVYYFQNQKWQKAEQNFQAAIQADPGLPEPYFNLALTKKKQGDGEQAISILKEYINLEKSEEWRKAALRLIDSFQER